MTGSAPPLAVRELTRAYGSLVAVDGVSFTARPGEVLALLGPNGAGKTTLLRMITGLLEPTSGQVEVAGESGRGLRRARQHSLGYCPQRLVVWRDLTCTEQLCYTAHMYGMSGAEGRQRSSWLLETFGLAEKAGALAAHLSGGMQRRLSIALAMVHDPALVVLDEPAAGLDPQSRVLVRDRLRALGREGKTILFSTHDMEEADRIADRAAIVDHGKLLALDAPDALKAAHGATNIVEISLASLDDAGRAEVRAALAQTFPKARLSGEVITIDTDEGAELMRPVRTVLSRLSVSADELRFRRRTLEDLFIELTGRRLRQ